MSKTQKKNERPVLYSVLGFPGGSDGKASACNAADTGVIPGSGRAPGEGNGSPLQCSCLENSMNQRSPVGYRPGGRKVRHDWATSTSLSISYLQSPAAIFHHLRADMCYFISNLNEGKVYLSSLLFPLLSHPSCFSLPPDQIRGKCSKNSWELLLNFCFLLFTVTASNCIHTPSRWVNLYFQQVTRLLKWNESDHQGITACLLDEYL